MDAPLLLQHLLRVQDEHGSLFLWPSVAVPIASLAAGWAVLSAAGLRGLLPIGHADRESDSESQSYSRGPGASALGNRRDDLLSWAVSAVVALELLFFGVRYNPSAEPGMLYPDTPGTQWLQQHLGNARFCGIESPRSLLPGRDGQTLPRGIEGDLPEIRQRNLRNLWKGDVFPPDTALPYGLADVRGKESLLTRRYRMLVEAVSGPGGPPLLVTSHFTKMESPIFDLAGVEYFVGPPGAREVPEDYERVYHREISIYRNPRALPRAFVVGSERALLVGDFRRIPGLLAEAGDELGSFAFVEGASSPAWAGRAQRDDHQTPNAQAAIQRYHDHAVDVVVPLGTSGLLVLTDAFYPGWRVNLDGVSSDGFPVNLLFRGVWLPPKAKRVQWVYQPRSVMIGLWLSLFSLAALAAAACVSTLAFSPAAIRPRLQRPRDRVAGSPQLVGVMSSHHTQAESARTLRDRRRPDRGDK